MDLIYFVIHLLKNWEVLQIPSCIGPVHILVTQKFGYNRTLKFVLMVIDVFSSTITTMQHLSYHKM